MQSRKRKNKYSQRSKQKKTLLSLTSFFIRRCVISFLILTILLFILLAVILLVLLIKPKQSVSKSVSNPNPVLRWNPIGLTIAGISQDNGFNSSQLDNPWGLALTYDLTLYIADRYNNRIQKYKRNSSIGESLPNLSSATLARPANIFLDSNENLYIADGFHHRVLFWDKSTNSTTTIAGTGAPGNATNELNYPYGITRDINANILYIADHYNHRIMAYSLNTNSCYVVATNNNSQLNLPISIYFDSISRNLFVSSIGSHQILQWTFQTYSWQLIAGSASGTSGSDSMSLNGPLGFTFDPMGNLYVVDMYNHRIQFFFVNQLNGTTIAGVTSESGSNSTLLNHPYDVILDSQLNIYVSDNQNHRVQKFLRY